MQYVGKMYTLYLITGQNDKIYVGQTTLNPPQKRWAWHQYTSRTKRDYHFVNAIRKHGPDFFTFSILGEVNTKKEADNAEKLYILLFKAYDPKFGYNSTYGGEGVSHTEETKVKLRNPKYRTEVSDEEIVKEYLECKNYSEVSRRLNISYTSARSRYLESKLEKEVLVRNLPSSEKHYAYRQDVLIEDIIREYRDCKSFSETGRRLGVSENLIRNRYYKAGEPKLLNQWEGSGENRASYRKDISTDEIVSLYKQLGSYAEVGRKLKVNPGLVRHRCINYLKGTN